MKLVNARRDMHFIPSLHMNGKYTLIITNVAFWISNEDALMTALNDCNAVHAGMTIEFNTEEDRAWFLLKWQ